MAAHSLIHPVALNPRVLSDSGVSELALALAVALAVADSDVLDNHV